MDNEIVLYGRKVKNKFYDIGDKEYASFKARQQPIYKLTFEVDQKGKYYSWLSYKDRKYKATTNDVENFRIFFPHGDLTYFDTGEVVRLKLLKEQEIED